MAASHVSVLNPLIMFGLFKKKSKAEVLQEKYLELLKRSHTMSTSNRAASDKLFAEAQEVLRKIDELAGR
jgi:hypothetical protein